MAEEKKKTGNKSQPKLIENLKKKTHFNRQEIEALCKIYKELISSSSVIARTPSAAIVPPSGLPTPANKIEGLDRTVFRELVHNAFDLVTEEVLIDRIFCAFDRNNDGVIKLDNWICGLSTFLRGTLEERTAFCFLVYDLNADGYITRDEMMHLLRDCLMKSPQDEDPEEGVRDLVELALRKMDIDKDGKISSQDFLEAVTIEPLLLEAFGQCLPTEAASQTFMASLSIKRMTEMREGTMNRRNTAGKKNPVFSTTHSVYRFSIEWFFYNVKKTSYPFMFKQYKLLDNYFREQKQYCYITFSKQKRIGCPKKKKAEPD